MSIRRCIIMALLAVTLPSARAEPSPQARADAVIAALSTGDPAACEAAAQANFAPAFLATRTPAARADFVARFHSTFGTLKTLHSEAAPDSLNVTVVGARGPTGVITFDFEPPPLRLIKQLQVMAQAGGDGDRAPKIPPPPITGQMPEREMSAALERWIAPYVQHGEFSGVLLIAKDGKPFVVRAYGLADRERKVAASDNTTYNIASIGKKFTQVAIASLIQAGRLKLTASIGDVLPDYPEAQARSATIAQLVTMQGGISDFFGPEFEAADKARFDSNHAYYGFVSHLPQRFAPGTRSEYCNGCYVVLGEIVERVSGQRFEDYVQANVLAPAGMTRSGYFRSDRLPANAARPYTRNNGPDSPFVDTTAHHGVTGSGAGGVYATAPDLLAFDNSLREGHLLNAEMTAWVLGGTSLRGTRNTTDMGVAGGSPGTSALLESGGHWAVIVTANVDPMPEHIGTAISKALNR